MLYTASLIQNSQHVYFFNINIRLIDFLLTWFKAWYETTEQKLFALMQHAVSVILNRLVLKLAIYNASSIKQINKTEHHTRVPHMHVSLESFESYLACYPRPRVLLFLGYLGSGRCPSGLIYLPIFCFSFSSYYRFCYCFYHLM